MAHYRILENEQFQLTRYELLFARLMAVNWLRHEVDAGELIHECKRKLATLDQILKDTPLENEIINRLRTRWVFKSKQLRLQITTLLDKAAYSPSVRHDLYIEIAKVWMLLGTRILKCNACGLVL